LCKKRGPLRNRGKFSATVGLNTESNSLEKIPEQTRWKIVELMGGEGKGKKRGRASNSSLRKIRRKVSTTITGHFGNDGICWKNERGIIM